DYASAERFPTATRRIVGDIEQNLRDFPIDGSTYVVIVTRGHRNDGKALGVVIDSPAQYLGLIGSKAKIKLIYDDLLAAGVDPHRLTIPSGQTSGKESVAWLAAARDCSRSCTRRANRTRAAAKECAPCRARRICTRR